MVFAKKKWGQNFLVDNNLLEKIIKTINVNDQENVLEIGPGQGALSEKIVDVAKSLSMVEIDPDLIKVLKVHEKLLNLDIINEDILKVNLKNLEINSPVVVGNIPYNITSPIIFWLIDHFDHWDRAYLMVQKEVAHRLTAKIGTKDYSRVTVMTGLFLISKSVLLFLLMSFCQGQKSNLHLFPLKKEQISAFKMLILKNLVK